MKVHLLFKFGEPLGYVKKAYSELVGDDKLLLMEKLLTDNMAGLGFNRLEEYLGEFPEIIVDQMVLDRGWGLTIPWHTLIYALTLFLFFGLLPLSLRYGAEAFVNYALVHWYAQWSDVHSGEDMGDFIALTKRGPKGNLFELVVFLRDFVQKGVSSDWYYPHLWYVALGHTRMRGVLEWQCHTEALFFREEVSRIPTWDTWFGDNYLSHCHSGEVVYSKYSIYLIGQRGYHLLTKAVECASRGLNPLRVPVDVDYRKSFGDVIEGTPMLRNVRLKGTVWHLVTPSPLPFLLSITLLYTVLGFYDIKLTVFTANTWMFVIPFTHQSWVSNWPLIPWGGVFVMEDGEWLSIYTPGWMYWKFYIPLFLVPVVLALSIWHKEVYLEGCVEGLHNWQINGGFLIGWASFILSEAMLFLTFFASFFYQTCIAEVFQGDLSRFKYAYFSSWSDGFNGAELLTLNFMENGLMFYDRMVSSMSGVADVDPFGLPFLNTLILLSSGMILSGASSSVTVLYSRFNCLMFKLLNGTTCWIMVLGVLFLFCQYLEYGYGLAFNFSDGPYANYFLMITGLHGLHVFMGILFLALSSYRYRWKQVSVRFFSITSHVNWTAAAMSGSYWHFVDCIWIGVWLGLYQTPLVFLDHLVAFVCGMGYGGLSESCVIWLGTFPEDSFNQLLLNVTSLW